MNPISSTIPPAISSTTAATNGAGSSSAGSGNQLGETEFVRILAAELQAQDPTSPMDPTQFIGQQVQFNMLDQLTQIRSLIANQHNSTSSNNSGQQPTTAPVTTPAGN